MDETSRRALKTQHLAGILSSGGSDCDRVVAAVIGVPGPGTGGSGVGGLGERTFGVLCGTDKSLALGSPLRVVDLTEDGEQP